MAIKITKKLKKDKPEKVKPGTGVTGTAAVGHVKTTHADGSVEEQEEVVREATPLPEPLCNVGVSFSRTFNLGDFNSLKIQCSLNVPSPVEDIEDAFTFAKGWAEGKLNAIQEEVEQGLNADE
jgi:hypothetical protein